MQDSRSHFSTCSCVIALLVSFAVSIPAWSAETVLHRFGSGSDGASPYAGVISDSAGNIYGTTTAGGLHGAGTVFELVYLGGNSYSETVLYNFTGGSDGAVPTAALAFDAFGNLYGTTESGGTGTCFGSSGCGVVFELVKSTSYSETVLYRFTGASDGGVPFAPLVFDASGNLYSTTTCGGSGSCVSGGGHGVVFELLKSSGYRETVLHRFTGGGDGGTPFAPVILDASGNLYGTTEFGGTGTCSGSGCGVVFELVKSSAYDEIVLHRFTGTSDGGQPIAPVVADNLGNLYGTAVCGGSSNCSGGSGGNGVVFEIVKSSGSFRVLHRFAGPDGAQPAAGLAFNSSGTTLYGTTFAGGTAGLGSVFRLLKSGSSFSTLHSFTGGSDGANPDSPIDLVEHKGPCTSRCGYGPTFFGGGTPNVGVVYVVSPI